MQLDYSRAVIYPIPDLPVFDHLSRSPGRWVTDPATEISHWQGHVSWITQCGQSTVRWFMGTMISAWNVRSDDGKTVPMVTLDPPYDGKSWQRIDENGTLKTGWLELTDTGISFHDHTTSSQRPSAGLVDILAADGEFRIKLSEKTFADTVCAYLAENTFRRVGDDDRVTFGARMAEDFILSVGGATADRRNRDVHAMVAFEEILEDTGWHAMTPEEIEDDCHAAADLLLEIEKRTDGEIAEDLRANVIPMRGITEGGRFGRILAHASAGRVTQSELYRFVALNHESLAPRGQMRPAG